MSYTFYTQGFVLNKRDYTESSQFYTIYTKECGKLHAICQGSRKIQSKLSPNLEIFGLKKFFLAKGKKNYRIIGIVMQDYFENILNDYQKLVYSSFSHEVTDLLIRSEQKDENVFKLLYDNLALLNKEANGYEVIAYSYVFKLLSELGMTPELFSCVKCRAKLKNSLENKFSLSEGGVICSLCINKINTSYVYPISDKVLILLRELLEKENYIPNLNNENKDSKDFIHIIKSYLNYNVDRNIKSAKLIN